MKVFVIQSHTFTPPAVSNAIRQAIRDLSTDAEVLDLDRFEQAGVLNQQAHDLLGQADLVIADVTGSTPNVMYELGIAMAATKPVAIIANSASSVPFDIAGLRFLVYDEDEPQDRFVELLVDWARQLLSDPTWVHRDRADSSQLSAFISYSHVDADFLNRLLVHIRPLQREGALDIWVDTRLKAGDQWRDEIDRALARSSVAVLLISADFLASDFIVNNELPPLLKRAEAHGTRIVPVILKPCRFTRDPNLSKFHAINDPRRPLAGLPDVEREAVYDTIAETVEGLLSPGS